jgi:hypothetical protein
MGSHVGISYGRLAGRVDIDRGARFVHIAYMMVYHHHISSAAFCTQYRQAMPGHFSFLESW